MDHELRARFFKALEQEIQLLMDPETGKVSGKYSRNINCPLCGEDEQSNELLFEKNGFTFVRCRSCGFIFTNPQVRSELLGDLYKHSNSNDLWVELQKSTTEQAWKTDYYLDSVRLIESHLQADMRPRLLDIGCNTGYFLEVAGNHRNDWSLKGVELSHSACEYARSKGLDVEETLLSDLDNKYRFDVYTLFGVMEHLPEPHGILEEIKKRVSPGEATLVLAIVPNCYSLYHMLLQDKSLSFDGRDHLLYFSDATLRKTFEKAGLEVLVLDTVLDGLGSIKRQMQWFDPNGSEETTRYIPESLNVLIENGAVQSFMQAHNLGLRLRILARYQAD